MISPNDILRSHQESGSFKLGNYALPPLTAGDYTLEAKVKLDRINKGNNVEFSNNSLEFSVTAPQFSLDPALVYSVHPLESSEGAYHTSLPHIVFSRKTLPWERDISTATSGKNPPMPWLCLLLLTDTEIANPANAISFAQLDPAAVPTPHQPDLLTPQITVDAFAQAGPKVPVMEMSISLFHALAPPSADLSLLTHTRQVDTSDKANSDLNPKGWFSVMIGNRVPQVDVNNTVYLVSLEGHQTAFVDRGTNGKARIRLVVLHKWSFVSRGSTLGEIVGQLAENIQPLSLDRQFFPLSRLGPVPFAAHVEYGYMPVNHHWRMGKRSPSWYRGPLVPVNMPTAELYSYAHADEALRFDKKTGMFDISYAAAWQLGRLMALNNESFYSALAAWKTNFERERMLGTAEQVLKDDVAMVPDELSDLIHAAETDEVLLNYLMELWNGQ